MPKKTKIVILDGYNVIRRIPRLELQDERSLQAGRETLIRHCRQWKAKKSEIDRLVVVFDGDSSVLADPCGDGRAGIQVIFTRTGEKADARIIELVEHAAGAQFTVVSDDGEVARKCKLLGAAIMSVAQFDDAAVTQRKARVAAAPDDAKNTLSSAQEREITESLMREWGADEE